MGVALAVYMDNVSSVDSAMFCMRWQCCHKLYWAHQGWVGYML